MIEYIDGYDIPQAHINALISLGFGGSNGRFVKITRPFEETSELIYLMQSDLEVPIDIVQEIESQKNTEKRKVSFQYRSDELVETPCIIKVAGLNIYNDLIRNTIPDAIENFNQIELGIRFEYTSYYARRPHRIRAIRSSHDIVIGTEFGAGGGRAGFPTNGNPYKYVRIQRRTSDFGRDVVEHVITHELGHCIGLRHTDFFDRSISCGIGGNEGNSDVGAIHIPGTPEEVNVDLNSVML